MPRRRREPAALLAQAAQLAPLDAHDLLAVRPEDYVVAIWYTEIPPDRVPGFGRGGNFMVVVWRPYRKHLYRYDCCFRYYRDLEFGPNSVDRFDCRRATLKNLDYALASGHRIAAEVAAKTGQPVDFVRIDGGSQAVIEKLRGRPWFNPQRRR